MHTLLRVLLLLIIFQLEEVKLSERTLKTRVKSLSNELSVLKYGLRTTPGAYNRSSKKRTSTTTERRTLRDSMEKTGSGGLRKTARRSLERGSVERRTVRTPSPRLPRFDPTAFVENKKQKQKDADIRKG